MYEPVINRVEQPCRGADMLNMPSARVLINSSACQGKVNPAACLISEKPLLFFFFRNAQLPLFISRWIFQSNNREKKKSRQLCQVFAVYNCKDNSQTATISQWIELSEFMAACVIIIIKQMHTGRQREKRGCASLYQTFCLIQILHIQFCGG